LHDAMPLRTLKAEYFHLAAPSSIDALEAGVMARRGEGVRAIARQLGCSRNTVRRYLRKQQAVRYGARQVRPCKLDPFEEFLRMRVEQARPRWIPATVLWREISERGNGGGLTQLRQWLAPLKRAEPEPVVRFEAPPGKQMQADFTTMRRGREPLIALVATMGYSRATFVKFAAGEDAATLCAGLREAFDYFGGVPVLDLRCPSGRRIRRTLRSRSTSSHCSGTSSERRHVSNSAKRMPNRATGEWQASSSRCSSPAEMRRFRGCAPAGRAIVIKGARPANRAPWPIGLHESRSCSQTARS
jgi:transposase